MKWPGCELQHISIYPFLVYIKNIPAPDQIRVLLELNWILPDEFYRFFCSPAY